MRKRGQLVVISLITIIVSAVVFISLIYISKSLATGKAALKVAAARDIALTIDTVYAYPYDMEFEYDVDLSKFIVDISENSVKVYDASLVKIDKDKNIIGNDLMLAEYAFAPANEKPHFILERPKKLSFKKENNKLYLTAITK
jgi:hypothetical protein